MELVNCSRIRIIYPKVRWIDSSTFDKDKRTYHVPPGISRRSNTRITSKTSSDAKAAAAAAPEQILITWKLLGRRFCEIYQLLQRQLWPQTLLMRHSCVFYSKKGLRISRNKISKYLGGSHLNFALRFYEKTPEFISLTSDGVLQYRRWPLRLWNRTSNSANNTE
jgi:hypothetical protein